MINQKGKEYKKGNVHTRITESLCWTAEIGTTMLINYTSKKKSWGCLFYNHPYFMDEQTKAQRTLTHSGSTAEVEGVSLELSPLGSLEDA